MQLNEIRCELKKKLTEHRYYHTIGVYYTAQCLAMRYGYDIEKAGLAAMLHDCAKQYPDEKLISICEENNIYISEEEYNNPDVLHQKAGAVTAGLEYGIKDREILDAISCHTTGRCGMTLLDKIIFVADFIEPGRKKLNVFSEVRPLAFIDINKAVIRILQETLKYLETLGINGDSQSKKTLDYFLDNQ